MSETPYDDLKNAGKPADVAMRIKDHTLATPENVEVLTNEGWMQMGAAMEQEQRRSADFAQKAALANQRLENARKDLRKRLREVVEEDSLSLYVANDLLGVIGAEGIDTTFEVTIVTSSVYRLTLKELPGDPGEFIRNSINGGELEFDSDVEEAHRESFEVVEVFPAAKPEGIH